MKSGVLAVLLGMVSISQPIAAASPAAERTIVGVGFEVIRVPNGKEPDLIGGIWYPSDDAQSEQTLDGFTQTVAPAGAIKGGVLPLVVISHGGGGTFAGHYDTALALARAGYVVASISHAGDSADDQSKVLMQWRRPEQLSRLIDFVLERWRSGASIDPNRIGAFGFSNGGFTVLVSAGGKPDFAKIDPYCAAHPEHDLCTALVHAGVKSVAGFAPGTDAWKRDARIRAIAAAAPAFGFTFDRAGLSDVGVPVLLWQAANDTHQPRPFYEDYLRSVLPRAAEYRVEKSAGHYAFLPPCNERLARLVPNICVDAPGFDRVTFHRRFNAALVRFFDHSLPKRR